jgi:uncharacterized protein (TIGR02996 family)
MHPEPFLVAHPERFLEDVQEHPQDDAPRLRFAEWLDEHGDHPLAEFIRVQCRLARLPVNHLGFLELEQREQQLLAEHEREWVGDLADMADWWTFRRGFVEEVSTTVDKFLANACPLFHRAPIHEVHLIEARDRIESLAASPFLQRISHLDLSNNLVRDQGAKWLANSPHLAHTRGINLSSAGIGDAGIKALAASPHLGELRELYLSDNRISNNGVRAFVQFPLARNLHLLHVRFNTIGPEGNALLTRNLGDRVQF